MKWGKTVWQVGLVASLLVCLVVEVQADSIFGPHIKNGFYAFVAEDTPVGESCSWSLGGKNLWGNPRLETCFTFTASRSWGMTVWANPQYLDDAAGAGDHGTLWVDGGTGEVEWTGGYQSFDASTRVAGIALAANDIVTLRFYPGGTEQVVLWGPDNLNIAEYGPAGLQMMLRKRVPWLANQVEPGWYSVVSLYEQKFRPGESCSESILVQEGVTIQAGRQVPLLFCIQWHLQADDPADTHSRLFGAWFKPGPAYEDATIEMAEGGIKRPQAALWTTGGDFRVRVKWYRGGWHEQIFEVSGTSRGIAFKPGDPPVYVEWTALGAGSRVIIEFGPDYAPWWAEFGPSGSLQN